MKIYIDKTTLLTGEKLIPLLYPLLGEPDWSKYHDSKFNKKAFENYCKNGLSFFRLTTINECDFIVFPYDYSQVISSNRYAAETEHYASLNKQSNKPILIFWNQDFELNEKALLHFTNYYLFHSSFFKTKVSERVYACPFFVEDTHKIYPLGYRSFPTDKPTVSFCGFAPPLGIPINKYYFKELAKYWAYRLKLNALLKISVKQAARVYAIKQLMRSKKIFTKFIIREWSGFDNRKGMFIGKNDEYYAKIRKEYFENINSADYVLCVRGNGNFSIRFYETLCHGKIPVFVNTDMALPFEQLIDWDRHAVIVNEKDIKHIDEKIFDFHRLNKKDIENIKFKNRELWSNYLTPEGFFSKLEMACFKTN